MACEKSIIVREWQKIFIQRERVRRELIHTKPGETICLTYEKVALLLKWIKELETKAKRIEERNGVYGITER